MSIYAVSEGPIDYRGIQVIGGYPEPLRINSWGLGNGRGFRIELDHRKQTSTVETYRLKNGIPSDWELVKIYKDEIITIGEVERVLTECGII